MLSAPRGQQPGHFWSLDEWPVPITVPGMWEVTDKCWLVPPEGGGCHFNIKHKDCSMGCGFSQAGGRDISLELLVLPQAPSDVPVFQAWGVCVLSLVL